MTSSKPVQPPATSPPTRRAVEPAAESGNGAVNETRRAVIKISTVSHTLDTVLAEQLRYFAFRERISESAVIEYALRTFFDSGEEANLGDRLREAGAALRRKS